MEEEEEKRKEELVMRVRDTKEHAHLLNMNIRNNESNQSLALGKPTWVIPAGYCSKQAGLCG